MYKKSSKGWMKHRDFIFLDLICLQIAYVIAYVLRHGSVNPYANPVYRNVAWFLLFADFVIILFYETFANVLKRDYYKEFSITVQHALLVELLVALYLVTVKEGDDYSRSVLYTTGILYVLLTYTVRVIWKQHILKKLSTKGSRSLLIVTTSDQAEEVITNIRKKNLDGFHIAGVVLVDEDIVGEEIAGVPVVATSDTAIDYVCKTWVDEVFLHLSDDIPHMQDLERRFAETGITVHQNLFLNHDARGRKQIVEKIGDYTVLTSSMNYMSMKEAFLKRTLDIIGGLVGCLATVVVFIIIAPIIFIQSPGPIFFSQTRVGKNGKLFKIYKFRSMYMDAEERKQELMEQNRIKDGMMFKLDFDPRVIGNKVLPNGEHKTGIGDFIRRTSLDEFPQFFNVLLGQLSLVGTRPPLVSETQLYAPRHRARLAVKPGITGMWQVSGRSEITDFEEVVRLDTQYINEWSIGLDLKILCKTVLVILKREGSM